METTAPALPLSPFMEIVKKGTVTLNLSAEIILDAYCNEKKADALKVRFPAVAIILTELKMEKEKRERELRAEALRRSAMPRPALR